MELRITDKLAIRDAQLRYVRRESEFWHNVAMQNEIEDALFKEKSALEETVTKIVEQYGCLINLENLELITAVPSLQTAATKAGAGASGSRRRGDRPKTSALRPAIVKESPAPHAPAPVNSLSSDQAAQ